MKRIINYLFSNIIATETSKVLSFGYLVNNWIFHLRKVITYQSAQLDFNYQILNKQTLHFTGFGGNDIAKFIDIQTIANTLILKLK